MTARTTTRRALLRDAGAAAGAVFAAPVVGGAQPTRGRAGLAFAPVLQQPALVSVFLEGGGKVTLDRSVEDEWVSGACRLTAQRSGRGLDLTLSAPGLAVERVHLRWPAPMVTTGVRVLGDAWERSYGDLGWGEVVPERPLPWYFLLHADGLTHGYGVAVGANAFAFWQCDREGVSLWLDVRNGGRGVLLGARMLAMATVIARAGVAGETPFGAARALCGLMSPAPRKSVGAIYGSNDWYYAYGDNTPAGILRDADLVAELAPTKGARPFTIADGGWEDATRFPDMPGLAAGIKAKGARPGIWVRPTQPVGKVDAGLLLPDARFASAKEAAGNPAFDPTIPEALHLAMERVRQPRAWGYELIKHDFSTYDLLGQWGFAMGPSPALAGWNFHDRGRTSAEIVRSFYQAIREASSDAVVIGCNTVGHLGAGIFDAQRIGDDVSGRAWERTRKMGVNTLGFRLPQHGAFFSVDADCVPLTAKIPWRLTREWLGVVAQSRTVLLISPEPGAVGPEQKSAIRDAFALAAAGGDGAEPEDWLETHTPERWKNRSDRDERYHWLETQGADPFLPG